MGCCTGRCFMITLCVIQMVATVERQVFDFLGYMWAPIIVNFLQIIFVICGFFGTLQYRPKVVITYTIWSVLWIGWNIFIICFYLEVGILKRDMPILTLGTDNKSWWYDHGFDCQVNQNSSSTSPFNSLVGRQVPDEGSVTGCLLQYYYVEVIHAGIQCLLAAIGFCVSCHVVRVFTEEDDSCKYPVYSAGECSPLSPTSTLGSGPPDTCQQTERGTEDEAEDEDVFLGVVVTRRQPDPDRRRHRFCAKSRSCSAIHDISPKRSRCRRTIVASGNSPDPLARASFFSAHDSWTLPTYVSFNDDLESWSSLGLASRQ